MKKLIYTSVFLILVNLVSSVAMAQPYLSNKIQKNSTNLASSSDESVRFSRYEAFSDGNGALIKWNTKVEIGNIGFDIYRIEGKNSIKINQAVVPGTYLRIGNNSELGGEYRFFDRQGTFNSVYRIESISLNGKNQTSQAFYPRYESDLTDVGGQSSEEFQKAAQESNPITINENPVFPKDLKREVSANSSLSDPINQRWVASQPGVKIGVKQEGFYRVTNAELLAAGFDVNSSPANWQLYLNGIEQSINVVGNNYIEFYGKGIDTIHSDTNVYFLIVGNQPGKRILDRFRRGVGGNVLAKNFDYEFKRKERLQYAQTLLNGDTENFYGALVSPSLPTVLNFQLNGMDFTTGKATMEIALQGISFFSHRIQVKINGVELSNIVGSNKNLYSGNVSLPVTALQNGNNVLELLAIDSPQDFSLVSSIKVNYKKLYEANQNHLLFYTQNSRITNVEKFTTSNIRVLDLTYPDSPTIVTNLIIEPTNKLGTEYVVSIPANRIAPMYAFSDANLKQAFSIVPNIPSTISNPTNGADLLIITNRAWLAESNNWATYRQNDGLSVLVIDVDDIYDEFDFGIKGSDGIRSFLEFTQTDWQTAPDYVLLMGDASYDPKNYTGDGFHSYVPVRFVDTLYEETGSDEALADFNDDGLSEIAVGRIPARNPQDVTRALNKVINFEQGLPTALARGSLCVSDSPIGYDFAQLCTSVQSQLPASIPKVHINRDEPDSRTRMINDMAGGRYLVNYSGHGAAGLWATNSYFNTNDVPLLTNQNRLTVFTMLTCLNGYFIRPIPDSLSEALLKSQNGGAVAVWSSSGQTTPDIQQVMATRFYQQLGNNPSMIRMGDLIKDAKANLVGGRDVRLSWGLLGDPTLRVK